MFNTITNVGSLQLSSLPAILCIIALLSLPSKGCVVNRLVVGMSVPCSGSTVYINLSITRSHKRIFLILYIKVQEVILKYLLTLSHEIKANNIFFSLARLLNYPRCLLRETVIFFWMLLSLF